jgi:hypothetical protein
MAVPSWQKHLQTLLTSADFFRGKPARVAVGAAMAITSMPPEALPQPPQDLDSPTTAILNQRNPRRILRGFILARGPHKSVNPAKPTTTESGVAATPPTTAKPVAPPRPAGGGHASHASHSSHRSHSSAGWA